MKKYLLLNTKVDNITSNLFINLNFERILLLNKNVKRPIKKYKHTNPLSITSNNFKSLNTYYISFYLQLH